MNRKAHALIAAALSISGLMASSSASACGFIACRLIDLGIITEQQLMTKDISPPWPGMRPVMKQESPVFAEIFREHQVSPHIGSERQTFRQIFPIFSNDIGVAAMPESRNNHTEGFLSKIYKELGLITVEQARSLD